MNDCQVADVVQKAIDCGVSFPAVERLKSALSRGEVAFIGFNGLELLQAVRAGVVPDDPAIVGEIEKRFSQRVRAVMYNPQTQKVWILCD